MSVDGHGLIFKRASAVQTSSERVALIDFHKSSPSLTGGRQVFQVACDVTSAAPDVAGQPQRLVGNRAVRQCRLETIGPLVGNLGPLHIHLFEVRELFKMYQSFIGYFGSLKI